MNYAEIAKESRLKCLDLVFLAQTSHIGSLLGCADIFAVLFSKIDLDKDKFVLSAGWKAAMLYFHLWKLGRITEEELNSYCQEVVCSSCPTDLELARKPCPDFDEGDKKRLVEHRYKLRRDCVTCAGAGKIQSKFIGLAEPMSRMVQCVHCAKERIQDCKYCGGTGLVEDKFILFAGGSMGMGLSAGVALAWSKKQRGQDGKIYVLESDGGMQVGINTEAMRFARQHKLNNLVLIVDYNNFQAMGETKDIIDMSYLRDEMPGWSILEINGHDFSEIEFALNQETDKPMMIIANTIKGRGVSFMENVNVYHYKAPNEQEYLAAQEELWQR